MEDTLDKRANTMKESVTISARGKNTKRWRRYQHATDSGDYAKALSSLRRFYDYQFPNSGRWVRLCVDITDLRPEASISMRC